MRPLNVGLNHGLQTSQITWLGLHGKRRANLARAPRAGKTGDEPGQIWGFGCCNGNLSAIGESDKMRLHRAYLLKELERIEGAGHLAQFDFRSLRNALCL